MDAPVGCVVEKVVCQYDIYHYTVNVIYSISPVMHI